MSDLSLPQSLIDNVRQMGFPSSALKLAQQATNSNDSGVLLDWILTHENEVYAKNPNETHLTNTVIQKVMELGFSKDVAELAQRKTKSTDVETLIDWISIHDRSEDHRSVSRSLFTTDSLSVTPKKKEDNKKTDVTLRNDLLKLGFDADDIETCFLDLNINTTKKFNLKTKQTECIDWLISNSQRTAQSKAKKIERSRRQLRVPEPIKFNNNQNIKSHPANPQIITNNLLRQVHLEGRHQTTTNDEQQPSLTREEALMAGIDENLRRQSWTIHNLDQLQLIQEYIDIVAKIIDEDRHHIKRYSDDEEDDEEAQPIQPTTAKLSTHHQTKKIFTLADLTVEDRTDYRPHSSRALATPPREFHVPGASEEANWDPSLLKELDRIAVQLDDRSGESYRQLTNRLISECHISPDDHRRKIRAVFVWITNHIRYDINMSGRDNSLVKNEQTMDELCQLILNTRSCVCVGYAILFKRMCEHFNIRVDYVGGYTKRTKACINDTAGNEKSEKLSGHAWTMVYLDGETYFTDPTWSAASWSSSNEIRSSFSNTYYLVRPKDAIYQFRPDNEVDQHVDPLWTIPKFIQEPCFYPHYFRSGFYLEDKDTEWYQYRLIVDRSKQKSLTKSFRITTRTSKKNHEHYLKMYGYMRWSRKLTELESDFSQFKNTNYEYAINAVTFKEMNLTLADSHLNDRRSLWVAELKDIPIYPPNLNVYEIQYGLLRIFASDKSNKRYEPIFECIFEFQG